MEKDRLRTETLATLADNKKGGWFAWDRHLADMLFLALQIGRVPVVTNLCLRIVKCDCASTYFLVKLIFQPVFLMRSRVLSVRLRPEVILSIVAAQFTTD
jgi:hypothetical protein